MVRKFFGIFVLFCTVLVGLVFVFFLNKDSTKPEDNVVEELSCVPIKGTVSNKTVILRVDDVQAYSWVETTKHMVEDAGKLGVPLTLGIIPSGLQDDKELVTFLKSQACRVEFALHGLTHSFIGDGSVPEFGTLAKDEAKISISAGLDILRSVTSESVVTWIPPLNVHSEGTKTALKELGFKYLSAEGEGAFDYDAATFSYNTTTLVSPEKVVEACLVTFETSSHCIVMLHPQDFADGLVHNQEKYERYYLGLIEALKSEGVTFARFNELPLETR